MNEMLTSPLLHEFIYLNVFDCGGVGVAEMLPLRSDFKCGRLVVKMSRTLNQELPGAEARVKHGGDGGEGKSQ